MAHIFRAFGLSLLISVISCNLHAENSNQEQVNISKTPSWVNVVTISKHQSIPSNTVDGGVYYVLVDKQIKVPKNKQASFYSRYIEQMTNKQGVENNSQINISYDPSYQKVEIHSLDVIRDNQPQSRLNSAKISLIHQEPELDNLIYDGRLTVNIILTDIRVGDKIDYSYSVTGTNPVYKDLFSYQRSVEWSVPVHHQQIRILWGKEKPLLITQLKTNKNFSITQNNNFTEYSLNLIDSEPVHSNSEIPNWYNPYGALYLTDSKSWTDVVNWALPLFDNAIELSPEIKLIANQIRMDYPDKKQQIVQSLKLVQDKIRYLGLEMGANSHQPSPASETLQRRYGDCKDKTVLFVSILKALDIPASPALVDTYDTQALIDFPPNAKAFNHVITKVELDQQVFWLDPTRTYQSASLNDIYQPNYQYALVVKPGNSDLEKVITPIHSSTKITEAFDISKGGNEVVTHTIHTELTGYDAENQRYQVADNSIRKLQDQYTDFYARYYGEAVAQQPPGFEENDQGSLIQNESYQYNDLWTRDDEEGGFHATFYANTISYYLNKPEQISRNAPFAISYPKNIQQQISIYMGNGDWSFTNEYDVVDNQYFKFKRSVNFDALHNTILLDFEYKSKTASVEPDDINAYIKELDKAKGLTDYGVIEYFTDQQKREIQVTDKADYTLIEPVQSATEAKETTSTITNTGDLFEDIRKIWISLGLLSLIFALISTALDKQKKTHSEEIQFQPISPARFYLMSVLFFWYPNYWLYQNWKYIKNTQDSHIMPVARGIFSIIWFYPFFQQLSIHSQRKFEKNIVLPMGIAIIFAIIFFSRGFVLSLSGYYLLASLIIPFIFFPFIHYINNLNVEIPTGQIKLYNWRLRHTFLAISSLPFLALGLASSLNIVPDSEVMDGSHVPDYQITKFYRKGILDTNEKMIYFYSSAMFNYNNDGNGLTDQGVFSYWIEDGKFYLQRAKFNEIDHIEVKHATSAFYNTIITVTRKDDSSFMLFVSPEDFKDKLFIKKLKTYIKTYKT
ncbi:MAG: DUF3857 domain-containing transglutaminase family protein [bacterium]